MSYWLERNKKSVFVLITPLERVVVLSFFLFFLVIPFPFVVYEESSSRFLLYFAFVFYVVTLALPFTLPGFRPSFLHPICFYVIWFGMQSLLRGEFSLPISGLSYHRALGVKSEAEFDFLLAYSFLLDTIALLSLYAGYVLFPKIKMKFALPCKPRNLAITTCFWVVFSGFGLFALILIGGGVDQILMQRGLASDQRIASQIGGHWGFLAGIGVLAPTIWLACEPQAIRKKFFWMLLVIALILKFVSTGSRGGTIFPLLIIGTVYVIQTRSIPYNFVIIGVFAALLIVGGGGQFRKATMQSESLSAINIDTGVSGWISSALEEMHGQGAENNGQIAVLGAVPDEVEYLWGESYLSIPFIFLPSAIFGEKPDAGGRLLSTKIYNNPLNTIPPQTVGEAYWNFSVVGVVLIFIMHGSLLKLISRIFFSNSSHPLIVVLYVYFLFRFQLNSDSLYSLAHATLPIVLMYFTYSWPRFNFKFSS